MLFKRKSYPNMARVREFKRSLDAVNTNIDFKDLTRFSTEGNLIKQEPCDRNDVDSYDTCMPTIIESEDINSINIIENNISPKENICSQTESLCNITTNQIQKKSSSMDHAVTGNIKCIQKEKDILVIDEKNENKKALRKSNDIKRFNKKQGRDMRITKEKKNAIYCEICSLSYENLNQLKRHKNFYAKQNNYFCSNCLSNSCSHIRLKIDENVQKSSKYCCHFCKRMFQRKISLQSHLFHLHGKEIRVNVEDDSFSINNSTVSYSGTSKKKKMRQKTMVEYIIRHNKEDAKKSSENLNSSNVNNVLTIIKQENEWMDDEAGKSSTDKIVASVPRTSQKSNDNRLQKQPFVKIHVDSNMMKTLLGISCLSNDDDDDDDYLEKSFLYNSNRNSNKHTDNSNNINGKRYALRSLNNSIEVNNSEPSTIVRKNDQSGNKVRELLTMCKKCTISLIRCDDKLTTRSTWDSSKFVTSSSQVLQPVNRIFRKRRFSQRKSNSNESPSKNSFSRNNNSKDFIKNDSSVRSPPVKIRKRITNSKSSSSITLNAKRSRKFRSRRKKRSGRRRTLLKKVKLDLRKNESLEKGNHTNSKNSSPQKESYSKEIENKQSANAIVELKEVKVSLIKLPEIKKELIVSGINENATANASYKTFSCTICDMLLNTERHLKKHMKKYHTAYMSSICRARYASKRLLLKHYLREHDMWVCKCCVCYQFFSSRLSLKQHLLLHCIRITLSKNDRPLSSKNMKCHSNVKRYKCKRTALKILLRSQSTEHQNDRNERKMEYQEIDDNNRKKPKEYLHVSSIENLTNRVNESKENNVGVLGEVNDRQPDQAVSVELTKPFESNNTEVSHSRNNDSIEEPIPDTPSAAGESTICNEDRQIDLILHTNVIQPDDNYNNEITKSGIDATVNKQKYPCSICGTQFQKPENLFQHIRTYDHSFNNFCEICGLFFSKKKILKTHNNTTHNSAICSLYTLHCQFCNQGFRTENNLRIHELHYHASTITINNIRVTEFLKVSNGGINSSLPMLCNICGLSFNTFERYQLHSMYYYKGHIFPCTFCGNIFHGLNMVHRHNKLFHYPRNNSTSYKYKCSICYEGFAIESYFHAHKLHVHSNKEHIESPISNLALNSMHYNKMNKSYICSKCNIEFYSIAELMIHVEYYSNRGNYLCLKCPRKCCTLSILSEHIDLTHNDNKLMIGHKCGICGEILMSDISFLYHQNHLHSDVEERQVVSFSYKYSNTDLNINNIVDNDKLMVVDKEPVVIVHGPTSSFVSLEKCNISCPICAVKFEKEVHLKKHLAEYLDFGDYQCNECQRHFVNSDLLKKHIENHLAPGMPLTKYYCTVCNENCKTSTVLESHVAHLHARVIFKDVSSKSV
ncbi:uncharacterized protein LOC124430412 isoform X1 [Vespa crabro]|uniref:uncharacterized protein LOC124430412 isoform X1 n=2 Tax=Vespa crabro TaxID=7445 RepID=UPI001F0307C6|nr:uncharacterized protein LOC124430412 isoform X1 [Vespa crabro]